MVDHESPTPDPNDVESTLDPYRVPEIGNNPHVDALRHLQDGLGFIDTPELAAHRQEITAWLAINAAAVDQALNDPEDTPELAALQARLGPYVEAAQAVVDQAVQPGNGRERALLGMLLDQAMMFYDAGLQTQFQERLADIQQCAEGYGLTGELPELGQVVNLT